MRNTYESKGPSIPANQETIISQFIITDINEGDEPVDITQGGDMNDAFGIHGNETVPDVPEK